MATVDYAARQYGRFMLEHLAPKLDEFMANDLIPEDIVGHFKKADTLAGQPDKVGELGTKYLGYVLAYIAMDLALTDEQLEAFPNMGPAKVKKVRDAKPSHEEIRKRHQEREELRRQEAEEAERQAQAKLEKEAKDKAAREAQARIDELKRQLEEAEIFLATEVPEEVRR